MNEECAHEAHPPTDAGVSTDGYVLVGFLCRKCGEWIKA